MGKYFLLDGMKPAVWVPLPWTFIWVDKWVVDKQGTWPLLSTVNCRYVCSDIYWFAYGWNGRYKHLDVTSGYSILFRSKMPKHNDVVSIIQVSACITTPVTNLKDNSAMD